MCLTYAEFALFLVLHTYYRTNNTSFQYTLRRDDNEIIVGRLKVIADGASRLKRTKKRRIKSTVFGANNVARFPLRYGVSKSACWLTWYRQRNLTQNGLC